MATNKPKAPLPQGEHCSKGISSWPVMALAADLVADSIAAYPIPVYEELGRIKERLWNQRRDELLRSPDVRRMQADPKLSDDDVWDYIHRQIDDELAFPALYRDYARRKLN